LQKCSDSDVAPVLKQSLLDVEGNLALASFETAQFYVSSGHYAAAIMRPKTIIDKYPNFSCIDAGKRLYEALAVPQQVSPK
jgi:outer membrane protein assembly factor BamD (BamD/ComL family)